MLSGGDQIGQGWSCKYGLRLKANSAESTGDVECVPQGWAPGEQSPLPDVSDSITPKEIDPPFHARLDAGNTHRPSGDAHLAGPFLFILVYPGGMGESGIPGGVQNGISV